MEKIFKISFMEFSFLVEACIPPRPIARSMFWYEVIDDYYHIMTKEERKKLFDWIQLNPSFDINNEDCLLFYDRFNPDNQYKIYTRLKGEEDIHKCFLHKEQFYTKRNIYISNDYIINRIKI